MKKWIIDQSHSEVSFKVKHLVISTVRGKFDSFEGSVEATDDTFSDLKAHLSVAVSSISTNNAGRDGHLKSAEFFDEALFPTLIFTSTSTKKINDQELEVTGDLTIHGVTKPITLKVIVNGITVGMDKKRVASFDLSGSVNRTDFGLVWNAPVETGGVVVSEMVTIEAQVEVKEE